MDTSSSKLSCDSPAGAGQDSSVEIDTAVTRPPEIEPLGTDRTTLPPKANAFFAGCEPSEAKRLRVSALRILSNEKQTVVGRIDTGLELIARKRELAHGRYLEYVASLDISEKHAERCTNVARHFSLHRDLVSGVAWSALCDLAAKGVPNGVREEVIARRKAGEYLTRKDIETLIESASNPKSQPVTETACQGLLQSPPNVSEKTSNSLASASDRSRAVAMLSHAGSSVTGKPDGFAVMVPATDTSSDNGPKITPQITPAVKLMPVPQAKALPTQVQVHDSAVVQEKPPELGLPLRARGTDGDAVGEASSGADLCLPGDIGSGAEISADRVCSVLLGKLTEEEGRELFLCMKCKSGELVHLLGQRFGVVAADNR